MTEKIKPRLPVVICDPGCRDKRGHHYEFNNFLQEEIEISECLTNIHSKVREYKKVFYHSPYSIVPTEQQHIYHEQINTDAAVIADLSLKNICIVQQASELLIKSLKVEKSVIWENIIFPFPYLKRIPDTHLNPIVHCCFDRWFKPTAKSKECFFYFPRSRTWFENDMRIEPAKNTLLFIGSKRREKSYKNFVEFAGVQNLTPVSLPSYCDQRLYIDSILRAEYVWCGYDEAFQNKPSNTLLDAFSVSRKMIVSDYVKLNAAGFMPGKKRVCGGSVYKVYEPRCKHLLLKNNELFMRWLRQKLAKR